MSDSEYIDHNFDSMVRHNKCVAVRDPFDAIICAANICLNKIVTKAEP
jgi:hypothetical protein